MRTIILLAILFIGFGCASTKTAKSAFNLNGEWIPMQQEFGGKEFPSAVYESQKLILKDSIYTVEAESIDKGVVIYSNNKMDIYGKNGPNAGKHFMAIYQLESNQLTICYNLKGDGYPQGFNTKGHPLYFLSVYKMK